jgi:hypothetical protein
VAVEGDRRRVFGVNQDGPNPNHVGRLGNPQQSVSQQLPAQAKTAALPGGPGRSGARGEREVAE